MIHLLNSAMMPQPGVYKLVELPKHQFAIWLQNAVAENNLKSYIGYPETAQIIEEISGIKVPLNREQTHLETGDELLICKLKYRLQNPEAKGKVRPTVDDFEFFRCIYLK